MGAVVGSEAQKRQFQERLVRIRAGGENTSRHLYVGPVDEAVSGVKRRRSRVGGFLGSLLGEAVMLPLSLGLGAAALIAARVISINFLSEVPRYADVSRIGDIGIAIIILALLARILPVKSGARGKALVAGLVLMAVFESRAIVQAPDAFAKIYSAPYVANVMARNGQV